MILVVGSARSGFAYICQVFQTLGLDISHETFKGKDGAASWKFVDQIDTGDFRRYINGKEVTYLHQTRYPLFEISSLVPGMRRRGYDAPIYQATRHWLDYNRRAAELFPIALRYKVEQVPERLPEILSVCKISCRPAALEAAGRVHTNKNTAYRMRRAGFRGYNKRYTLEELQQELSSPVYDEVIELGREYGYL